MSSDKKKSKQPQPQAPNVLEAAYSKQAAAKDAKSSFGHSLGKENESSFNFVGRTPKSNAFKIDMTSKETEAEMESDTNFKATESSSEIVQVFNLKHKPAPPMSEQTKHQIKLIDKLINESSTEFNVKAAHVPRQNSSGTSQENSLSAAKKSQSSLSNRQAKSNTARPSDRSVQSKSKKNDGKAGKK